MLLLRPKNRKPASGISTKTSMRYTESMHRLTKRLLLIVMGWAAGSHAVAGNFSVASYNVELYTDQPFAGDRPKTAESKLRVQDSILELRADVLALQEMGSTNLLLELRATLAKRGLDYPHWEWVEGRDTNLHLALFSRFPIIQRRPQTNLSFLLNGRRFQVARGFLEVDLKVAENYSLTVLAAHLKSKRRSAVADEQDLREEEAQVLRGQVDRLLTDSPRRNLVVLGDLNDDKSSKAIKVVLGRGKNALTDTRPIEKGYSRDGDTWLKQVAWTHYFARDDSYSRIDYILVSQGLAHEWIANESFVLALPFWAEASDHRPIITRFQNEDR